MLKSLYSCKRNEKFSTKMDVIANNIANTTIAFKSCDHFDEISQTTLNASGPTTGVTRYKSQQQAGVRWGQMLIMAGQ